jgi:hypothetical protein
VRLVAQSIFDPVRERAKLRGLIGAEAEELVYTFCVIDREELERQVLTYDGVPPHGLELVHIRTHEPVHLSAATTAAFVLHTVADYAEQFFSWQEELEAGRTGALWPGETLPQCRMAVLARFAQIAARDGLLEDVPAIFDRCTATLTPSDEAAARDKYVAAIASDKAPCLVSTTDDASAAAELTPLVVPEHTLKLLEEASALNPHVAEPLVLAAQLHVQAGRWKQAQAAAAAGFKLLCEWGTCWDKRVTWEGWLAWARCIHFQAGRQEWPTTSGGMESLGAVDAAQRYRKLSVGDNFLRHD